MPNAEQTPAFKLDREKLELILGGHTAFALLSAGILLGAFNLLSRRPGLTEAEVQRELKLEAKPTRILVVGLLSLGMITREGEALMNVPLVEESLVDGKPGSLAPLFAWHARVVYPALADLVPSLQQNTNVGLRHFPGNGNTLYERLVSHPELEQLFQKAMSAHSQSTNAAMLEKFDFGKFKHVVDVGGGDGTNASALVNRFPNVRATVFDMPSVCAIASAKLEKAGLAGKVRTHAGNFLEDAFPREVDGVMFNHIMPIWSEQRNAMLLRKSYEVLASGGAVFIYNMMMRDDDLGPLTPAFGSLYFLALATGEGMLYRWKDYEGWLREAGFSRIERVEGLPFHHGLLVGWKS
jgi:L-tyrosine C(3)-methyltransferase